VTLHVHDDAPDVAQRLLDDQSAALRARLKAYVYSEAKDLDFAGAVAAAVMKHPESPSVAVAESCTGGLITTLITEIPGVSAWFKQGWVTYSNAAKIDLLGVDPALLNAHGAVSEQVARAMAEGARQRASADVGLATTGIAGPGGGSPAKPVGTVHIAMATGQGTQPRLLTLPYERHRNRVVSAWATLDLLRRWALGITPPLS
jgi:nicotinamide-nucleotide amidase